MSICFTAQKIKFSNESLYSECKYLLTLSKEIVYGKGHIQLCSVTHVRDHSFIKYVSKNFRHALEHIAG